MRLRLGRVVGLAIRVWFRRFVAIHLVAAVCAAPLVAVSMDQRTYIFGASGVWSSAWYLADQSRLRLRTVHCLLGYAWQFAVTVLVIRLAYGSLGRPAGGRGVVAQLRLLPFAVGSLVVFGALDAIVAKNDEDLTRRGVITGVVVISCIETLLGAAFALTVPAAADGHGLLAALGRSWQFGRGSRVRIAVLLVLPHALHFLLFLLIVNLWHPVPVMPWLVVVALFATFKACLLATAYRELCAMREGPRPDELGAIFA